MFIDDYSRYVYLYLIHEKSQSLDVFKNYKDKVENQLGKRIKFVRSNRGGEYYGRYDGSGVRVHLLNSNMNAVLSHNTLCQDLLAWMVLLRDEIERLKTW